jgi:hypothetical protein
VLLDIINAGSGRNSATQDKFPRGIAGTFIRLCDRALIKMCASVDDRGARRADGRGGSGAADAGGDERQVWARLGLHVCAKVIEEWAG